MAAKQHEIGFKLTALMDAKFKMAFDKSNAALQREQRQAIKVQEAELRLAKAQLAVASTSDDAARGELKIAKAALATERAEHKLATSAREAAGAQRAQHAAAGKLTGALGSMAGKIVGFASAYIGIYELTGYLKRGMEMAEKSEVAYTRMNAILQRVPGTTKQQIAAIKAQNKVLATEKGLRGSVLVAGEAQLGMMNLSAKTIMKLTPALADLAHAQFGVTVTGEDMVAVNKVIGKAMNGQVTSLRRMGIFLGKHTEEVLKNGTETQRTAVLVDVLTKKYGGLSQQLMNTPTGKLERLRMMQDQLQKSIGEKLLPLSVKWMTYLVKHFPEISGAADKFLLVLDRVVTTSGRAFSFAERNWTWLKWAVGGVATAVAGIKVGTAVVATIKAVRDIKMAIWGVKAAADATTVSSTAMWTAILGPIGIGIAGGIAGYAALEIKRAKDETRQQLTNFLSPQAMDRLAAKEYNGRRYNQLGLAEQQNLAKKYANEATARKTGSVFNVGTGRAIDFTKGGAMLAMPHYGNGGIVTRPTVALIGEQGPEKVVPLSRADAPIHITLNISGGGDARQVADMTVDGLKRMLRQVLNDERRVSYAGSR